VVLFKPGNLVFFAAIWALLITGISLKYFFHNADLTIEKDLKQALMLFFVYG